MTIYIYRYLHIYVCIDNRQQKLGNYAQLVVSQLLVRRQTTVLYTSERSVAIIVQCKRMKWSSSCCLWLENIVIEVSRV